MAGGWWAEVLIRCRGGYQDALFVGVLFVSSAERGTLIGSSSAVSTSSSSRNRTLISFLLPLSLVTGHRAHTSSTAPFLLLTMLGWLDEQQHDISAIQKWCIFGIHQGLRRPVSAFNPCKYSFVNLSDPKSRVTNHQAFHFATPP